jgi:hypothetical protein
MSAFQVKPTQLGTTERASFRTRKHTSSIYWAQLNGFYLKKDTESSFAEISYFKYKIGGRVISRNVIFIS